MLQQEAKEGWRFEEKSSHFNEARTEWQRRKSTLPFSPFRQHCTLSGAAQIEPAAHRHHFEKSAEPIYGDHMETAI
jgi:hypothetical protein